jgi:transcriptional regulator with XRE-family HTH domain
MHASRVIRNPWRDWHERRDWRMGLYGYIPIELLGALVFDNVVDLARHVSPAIRRNAPDLAYPLHMPHQTQSDSDSTDPRKEFGAVIKSAREVKGWTQEQLADASGVSRPTIQRWEQGKNIPEPETARAAFMALELDPRRIPVLLGYVTAAEMGLGEELPRARNADPTVEEALRILEDPNVPAAKKAEWLAFLRFRAQEDASQTAV